MNSFLEYSTTAQWVDFWFGVITCTVLVILVLAMVWNIFWKELNDD